MKLAKAQRASKLQKAINKYGLRNFKFIILEYNPGIILKENLKKNHILLLERENFWINKFFPPYNIFKTPGSCKTAAHNLETRQKKQTKSSVFLRYKKEPSLLERMAKLNSKPVNLKDKEHKSLQKFPGVRALAKYLKCSHKTVNKAIRNKSILKGKYKIHYVNG